MTAQACLHASKKRSAGLLMRAGALGVSAFAIVSAIALPAGAVGLPLGTYTATLPLSPYPTVSTSTDPSGIGFPVTFTNTSGVDGYILDHVEVDLPAGFSAHAGSASINAAGWTTSIAGSVVSADAPSATGGLAAGQSAILSFNADAPTVSAPTTYTFTTASAGVLGATGVVTDFTNAGSDPTVSVAAFANVVSCAPSAVCDTGTVGSSSNTTARIVTTTGSIQDFLGITVDTPTDAACLAVSSTNGRSQEVTFADIDTARTLTQTLTIDKSVVNAQPNNGAAQYGICYDSLSPTKTFKDHNGVITTVGWLPDCSATGLLPGQPCIVSKHKDGAGDVVIVFQAPGGDPRNIAGIPIPGT